MIPRGTTPIVKETTSPVSRRALNLLEAGLRHYDASRWEAAEAAFLQIYQGPYDRRIKKAAARALARLHAVTSQRSEAARFATLASKIKSPPPQCTDGPGQPEVITTPEVAAKLGAFFRLHPEELKLVEIIKLDPNVAGLIARWYDGNVPAARLAAERSQQNE